MRYIVAVLLFSTLISCNRPKQEDTPKSFSKDTFVQRPDWTVRAAVPPSDTSSVLEVQYRDEIGGLQTAYCMAMFENEKTKEYLLVAPWMSGSLKIQKANLLSDLVKTVPRDSTALALK